MTKTNNNNNNNNNNNGSGSTSNNTGREERKMMSVKKSPCPRVLVDYEPMPAFFSSSLALIMDPDDVSDFSGGFSGVSSEGTTDSNNKVLLTTTAAAAAAAAAEATTTSSGQMGKLMQDEDDVTAIFRMPLSQACERLGATKEALKKQARTHGLSRWPSRRLLSVARVAKSLADYMDYLEETNADEKTKKLVAQASLCVACEYKETQRNSKTGVSSSFARLRQGMYKIVHKIKSNKTN